MLKEILTFKGVSELDKKQQKYINGGSGCAVFIRYKDGSMGWSAQDLSVERAQEFFATDGDWLVGGYRVTGYCCASCS